MRISAKRIAGELLQTDHKGVTATARPQLGYEPGVMRWRVVLQFAAICQRWLHKSRERKRRGTEEPGAGWRSSGDGDALVSRLIDMGRRARYS
jgi:hypothetical protein